MKDQAKVLWRQRQIKVREFGFLIGKGKGWGLEGKQQVQFKFWLLF
jgi:hypothetical protein